MIKTCSLEMNAGSVGCEGDASHTCWMRNEAVFGDGVRHVFGFSSNGTLERGKELGATTSEYFADMRPWFSIVGWSVEAYAFASGGSGHSYSVWFEGGVAASDQDGVESLCTERSTTISTTTSSASTDGPSSPLPPITGAAPATPSSGETTVDPSVADAYRNSPGMKAAAVILCILLVAAVCIALYYRRAAQPAAISSIEHKTHDSARMYDNPTYVYSPSSDSNV
eukprot:m.83790 g.83790  ORF g.83790 m.83790 type:complete len:225 (-) comp12728_c0_seq2:301-975(-)